MARSNYGQSNSPVFWIEWDFQNSKIKHAEIPYSNDANFFSSFSLNCSNSDQKFIQKHSDADQVKIYGELLIKSNNYKYLSSSEIETKCTNFITQNSNRCSLVWGISKNDNCGDENNQIAFINLTQLRDDPQNNDVYFKFRRPTQEMFKKECFSVNEDSLSAYFKIGNGFDDNNNPSFNDLPTNIVIYLNVEKINSEY